MRKLIISIVLVLLIYMCYDAVYVGNSYLGSAGYTTLQSERKSLDLAQQTLDFKNNQEFTAKKMDLNSAVELYNSTKTEYETLAAEQKQQAYNSTDLYDIDFLWTQIGNYATNNGIILKFDVVKSITTVTESTEYTVCDLEFMAIGNYIGVTDFIYDIEDDDRFELEISEFTMKRPDEEDDIRDLYPENTPEEVLDKVVKSTFKIKNLPINASSISSVNEQEVDNATSEIEGVVNSGVTSAIPQS